MAQNFENKDQAIGVCPWPNTRAAFPGSIPKNRREDFQRAALKRGGARTPWQQTAPRVFCSRPKQSALQRDFQYEASLAERRHSRIVLSIYNTKTIRLRLFEWAERNRKSVSFFVVMEGEAGQNGKAVRLPGSSVGGRNSVDEMSIWKFISRRTAVLFQWKLCRSVGERFVEGEAVILGYPQKLAREYRRRFLLIESLRLTLLRSRLRLGTHCLGGFPPP